MTIENVFGLLIFAGVVYIVYAQYQEQKRRKYGDAKRSGGSSNETHEK